MPIKLDYQDPKVTLVARIAGGFFGSMVSPSRPSLHLVLLIQDLYSGFLGIDGQPDDAFKMQGYISLKTGFYDNVLPTRLLPEWHLPPNPLNKMLGGGENIVVRSLSIPIDPPARMSPKDFAEKLISNAKGFNRFVTPYSIPKKLGGAVMRPGEYNSSSYVSGLLQSVMGYVPRISIDGYQTPGWETPIPRQYFSPDRYA